VEAEAAEAEAAEAAEAAAVEVAAEAAEAAEAAARVEVAARVEEVAVIPVLPQEQVVRAGEQVGWVREVQQPTAAPGRSALRVWVWVRVWV
jgi:hypothetical protein